jgi:transposase InsO family protein
MLTASMIEIDSCPCPTPTLATASWTVGNSLPSLLSNLIRCRPTDWFLGRFSFLTLRCIDDASRLAFSKIMKTERKGSAVAFLKAAVAYYASLGVTVERVMTDNGSCYRSSAFAKACRRLHLKHIRTKPYTPRTNGKAERFIQTSLREWAYARAYLNSKQRAQELPFFMHRYNWHRLHASIGAKPPIIRLGLTKDNLLRLHI